MSRLWGRLAEFVHARPVLVLAGVGVVAVGLAIGATRLEFETSQDSLIGADSQVAVDNRAFQDEFGGELMLALFTAEPGVFVEDLFAGDNLAEMQRLDAELRASGLYHAVLSPLTALEFSARELAIAPDLFAGAEERVREAAVAEALAAGASPAGAAEAGDAAAIEVVGRVFRDAPRIEAVNEAGAALGLADPLTIENPAFVKFLIYADASETVVRSALDTNFTDPGHALMLTRLEGNIDIAEMGDGVVELRALLESLDLDGFEVMATGTPVLLDEINDYLQGGMVTLGALAFGVMVAVLFVVFRVRWRLLSLIAVVFGGLWGFGLMGFVGVPLTLITISGLPILIGVGVDFAIQTHSRFEEEVDVDGDSAGAMRRLSTNLAPALLVAAVAAGVGFLALQISEVPQIREFGTMLALGVAALFVAGLVMTLAVLALRERRRPTTSGRGAIPSGALERVVRRMVFAGRRRVLPIAVLGFGIIVAGLAVEGRFTIDAEPEAWIPQDGDAVQSLEELRAVTNTSSDVSLLVEAPDVTADEIVFWMEEFAQGQLAKHPETLLGRTSIASISADVTGVPPDQDEVQAVLSVAPDDFLATFVSPDRTATAIVFPIADVSLDERGALLDEMRADLDPPAGVDASLAPPEGTRVTPAGIATIGVELVEALEANREVIAWAAILAVAIWLLLFYRGVTKALLPLAPVLIAVGLSSLVTWLSGVSLSPITAVSAPLVIATCTEFSVLILARYVEDRERGLDPEGAVAHGAVRIGRAFTASGLTTVGGFAVLAFSAFPLLSDFGILVALNVVVALVSALMVLPPLLMWADEHPRLSGFTPGRRPGEPEEPAAAPVAEPLAPA